MSEHGFSGEIKKVLQEELKTHSRKGPGGSYDYYKGEDVIKQLNKAFGHCWSSEVVNADEMHGQILIQASVWTFMDGDTVTHHGYGSAQIPVNKATNKVIDIGNAYKSAYTGAIKKAAEQFGIGLGTATASTKTYQKPARPSAPSNQGFSSPPRDEAVSPPTPSASRPTRQPLRPSAGLKPRQPAVAPKTEAKAPAAPVTRETIPVPATNEFNMGVEELSEKCTDLQRGAIERVSKRKSLAIDNAIASALKDSNKNISNLTKADAAAVIRYCNGQKGA